MSIYHLSVKIISRSSGRSSVAAAAYRSGDKLVDERQNLTHDYTRKSGVDHSVILSPDQAPAWSSDRQQLWNNVELAERRKDSRLARECEVALPVELVKSDQISLVKQFAQDNFVARGMIADINIHDQDSHNPHAHIMLTTREITAHGFGKKNSEWNKKEELLEWRKGWELAANKALEQAGNEQRIDCRSYEDQGINKIPGVHLGPNVIEMHQRGIDTERYQQQQAIEKKNRELAGKVIELDKVRDQIQEVREFRNARPAKKNLMIKDDEAIKIQLASELTTRASKTKEKIEEQQTALKEQQQQHEDQEPAKPGRWQLLAMQQYKKTVEAWTKARDKIIDWVAERLHTLNKRLVRINPYLNEEFAMEKATEKIDQQNPAKAEEMQQYQAEQERQRQQQHKEQQKEEEKREKEFAKRKEKRLKEIKKKWEKEEKERKEKDRGQDFGMDL